MEQMILRFRSIGIGEALTLSFVFGVGIALLVKAGFYGELGVGWYLNTLTAQQIFMLSIGYIIPTIIGAGIGVFVGLVGNKKEYILIAFLIVFVVILGVSAFFRPMFGVGGILAALLGVSIASLKMEDFKGEKVISKAICIVMYICCILFAGYQIFIGGEQDARAMVEKKDQLPVVEIKKEKEAWLLIEMSGDKALLMNKQNTKVFKIVEYKDIEIIKSQ